MRVGALGIPQLQQREEEEEEGGVCWREGEKEKRERGREGGWSSRRGKVWLVLSGCGAGQVEELSLRAVAGVTPPVQT